MMLGFLKKEQLLIKLKWLKEKHQKFQLKSLKKKLKKFQLKNKKELSFLNLENKLEEQQWWHQLLK